MQSPAMPRWSRPAGGLASAQPWSGPLCSSWCATSSWLAWSPCVPLPLQVSIRPAAPAGPAAPCHLRSRAYCRTFGKGRQGRASGGERFFDKRWRAVKVVAVCRGSPARAWHPGLGRQRARGRQHRAACQLLWYPSLRVQPWPVRHLGHAAGHPHGPSLAASVTSPSKLTHYK